MWRSWHFFEGLCIHVWTCQIQNPESVRLTNGSESFYPSTSNLQELFYMCIFASYVSHPLCLSISILLFFPLLSLLSLSLSISYSLSFFHSLFLFLSFPLSLSFSLLFFLFLSRLFGPQKQGNIYKYFANKARSLRHSCFSVQYEKVYSPPYGQPFSHLKSQLSWIPFLLFFYDGVSDGKYWKFPRNHFIPDLAFLIFIWFPAKKWSLFSNIVDQFISHHIFNSAQFYVPRFFVNSNDFLLLVSPWIKVHSFTYKKKKNC